MLLPYSTLASRWEEEIDRQRERQIDRNQGREGAREEEREGKKGEGGIIIPSINPIADVLLVLGCEGVACDPVHLGPNERLTDWLTSLCQRVCMLDQILLDAGPGNDLGAYGGRKKGHPRTLSECRAIKWTNQKKNCGSVLQAEQHRQMKRDLFVSSYANLTWNWTQGFSPGLFEITVCDLGSAEKTVSHTGIQIDISVYL